MNIKLVVLSSLFGLSFGLPSIGFSKTFRFSIIKDSSAPGNCCDFVAGFSSLNASGMKFDNVTMPVEGNPNEFIKKHQFLISAHPDASGSAHILYSSIDSTVKGQLKLKYTVTCSPRTMNCPKDKNEQVVTRVTSETTFNLTCGKKTLRKFATPLEFDEAAAIHDIGVFNSDKKVSGTLDATVTNSRPCD